MTNLIFSEFYEKIFEKILYAIGISDVIIIHYVSFIIMKIVEKIDTGNFLEKMLARFKVFHEFEFQLYVLEIWNDFIYKE